MAVTSDVVGPAPVCIGGRALDLLTALVERVTKGEHLAQMWPETETAIDALAMFYRARPGAGADAVAELEHAIDELHLARLPFNLGVQAEVLADHGRLDDARLAICAALDRSTTNNEPWCRSELLRIEASIPNAEDQPAKAEAVLVEAIALADRIGALSWRLRAPTDLARTGMARAGDAHAMLSSVYAAFTEGFSTRDLAAAHALLRSESR